MNTGKMFLLSSSFFMMELLMPFGGIAQEEHPMHMQHRHPEYSTMPNPIARSAKSVLQGKKLYEKHCRACHGEAGKGGIGPDLTDNVWKHGNADGEVFLIITDGVRGTAMKGFKNELSDEMRWHLVNFIAGLRKNAVIP